MAKELEGAQGPSGWTKVEGFSLTDERPGFLPIPPSFAMPDKPSCPACGSNDTTAYYDAPKPGHEYALGVLDCNNCGAEYDLRD